MTRDRSVHGCGSARQPALMVGLLLAIAVETVVLHLWLSTRHPLVAWSLTSLSLLSAVWLVGDFAALARAAVLVGESEVALRIGWRVDARLPRSSIVGAIRATWRDIPAPGSGGYVDLTKPAEPNVLLTCDPAVTLKLFGGLRVRATTIGVAVDDPEALVRALRL